MGQMCAIETRPAGPLDQAGPPLFSGLGERWLQNRRPSVKDSTYIKYEIVWRRHIRPALGDLPVSGVTASVAEAFAQTLLDRGLAVKTRRDILTVLRSILAYAAEQGWLAPEVPHIRYPKAPRKQIRVLSRAEQDRLAAYLYADMDCCRFGILLALLTGIRLGELCALRWGNISWTERTITIDATMQRLRQLDGQGARKTHVIISSPKSDASIRVIPMSDHVAALCRQMGRHSPACFILTGTEQYMEPRAVQFRMEKIAAACGLEGVHFHTLRHTFATRSVEVGFELKSLSEILGHADTSITLDRYVHISMELKRANMNKLAQAGL